MEKAILHGIRERMAERFGCNNVTIGIVFILIARKPHSTLHQQDVLPVRPFVLLKVSSSFFLTSPYDVAPRAMASAARCTGGEFVVCTRFTLFHHATISAQPDPRLAHQLNYIMQRKTLIHSWKRRAVHALVVPLLLLAACQHDPVSPTDQPTICFTTQVLPIFQSNCAKSGCHAGDGGRGLNLATADGILREVTPGQPLKSRAYTAMFDVWGGIMPPSPNAPVSAAARQIVELWILQGADITCTGN
jgi:hypothetical protein